MSDLIKGDAPLPSTLLNKTIKVRQIKWLYPIDEPVKPKRPPRKRRDTISEL